MDAFFWETIAKVYKVVQVAAFPKSAAQKTVEDGLSLVNKVFVFCFDTVFYLVEGIKQHTSAKAYLHFCFR